MRKTTWVLLALLAATGGAAAWALGVATLTGGALVVTVDQLLVGSGTSTAGDNVLNYSIGANSVTPMSGGGFKLTPGVVAATDPPEGDLNEAHAFPTPFRPSQGHTKITFTKLTALAQIDVYTMAGQKVAHLEKNDETNKYVWFPVTNQQGTPLASGIYLFIIHQPGVGAAPGTRRGKIMIIK
jgi:hypothetical protein